MEISQIKREIKLRQWTEMAQACMNSGQTVRAWCQENGITAKTYYYRLRRVREAALNKMSAPPLSIDTQTSGPAICELGMRRTQAVTAADRGAVAVTLMIGGAHVSVHNGADADTVATTLRTVAGLC